jgi:hypothetical protein
VADDPETLAILYDEAKRTLDRQFDTVEGLKGRAQQILGFATVIVSILAAFDPAGHGVQRALVVVDLVLFVATGAAAFAAWRFHSYRDDPDAAALVEYYAAETAEKTRRQVIENRLASIEFNARIIERQTLFDRIGTALLVLAGAVLVAVVVLHLFS